MSRQEPNAEPEVQFAAIPDDPEPLEQTSEPQVEEVRESNPSTNGRAGGAGRLGASFAVLLGLGLMAAALALATAPEYSWKMTRIARQLAGMGYDHGLFAAAGLVIFSLGVVGRSISAARRSEVGTRAVSSPVNELARMDLEGMRDALEEISEVVAEIAGKQQMLLQQNEQEEAQEKNYDALFRLAASLDQLNARLDDRVSTLASEMQQRIGAVVESVHESRAQLENVIADSIARAPAYVAPHPASGASAAAAKLDDLGEDLKILVDLEEKPAEGQVDGDFFDDLDELSSIVGQSLKEGTLGAPEEQVEKPAQPQPPQALSDKSFDLDALLPEDNLRRALGEDHEQS
jgi:hypothetical protein